MLRYLKETAELGLEFENLIIRVTEIINKAKRYTDSNYVNNVSNKKFIISYVFFVSQGLVV